MARPRSTSGALAQVNPAKIQKPEISRKKDSIVEYSLNSPNGAVFMMSSVVPSVYDENTNSVRSMRYCASEPSVYTDEQSTSSVKTPIVFSFGKLFVPHTMPNLMKFLDMHPRNSANGGSLFTKVDYEQDAKKVLDEEFLNVEAIATVRDKSIDELLPVAIAFGINVDAPVAEIKYDLLQIAKSNPKKFIEAFDNPVVAMKAKVKKAISFQIIKAEESGVKWFDSNKQIVSVPAGMDPIDVMVRYCLTESAAPVVAEIDRQMNS